MALPYILCAVLLLLWAFAFLYLRSYVKRRTGQERILGEFREEINKLIAEIDAATDRDTVLVEDRIKTLRGLLEDADKRILTHKRELDRRKAQEDAYAQLGRRRPRQGAAASAAESVAEFSFGDGRPELEMGRSSEVSAPPLSPAGDTVDIDALRQGEGAAPLFPPAEGEDARGEEAASSAPPGQPRFVRAEEEIEPVPPPFFEQVTRLAREGFSPELIARRLGATVAEVDLVIALNGGDTFGKP